MMSRLLFALLIAALGTCVSAQSPALSRAALTALVGQTVRGRVVSVVDGDTIRVRLDGSRRTVPVRLEGIDAPEAREPFSTQARNALRVMVFDKSVMMKATDVDPYDRLVARVMVDGRDSSVELLQAGLACHFTRFENDPVLARAQATARSAGSGFWAAGAAKPRCVNFSRTSPGRDGSRLRGLLERVEGMNNPSRLHGEQVAAVGFLTAPLSNGFLSGWRSDARSET